MHLSLVFFMCFGLCLGGGPNTQSNFFAEEPCSSIKGACVLEKECPHDVGEEQKSLCPNQKSQGAVCCKNYPEDKLGCFQLHNTCREKCPQNLDLGRKGCTGGTTCCVLV